MAVVESWISPEETPALAEAATFLIEERLSRFSPTERAAYWHSVRKCYNTPYNAPPPRSVKLPVANRPLETEAAVPAQSAVTLSAGIRAA